MNILMCSVGRRGELVKNFKNTMGDRGRVIATDCSRYAPALYFADDYYIVPEIDDVKYIATLVSICKKEKIKAIVTFIDPEIAVLSKNRENFEKIGVIVLVPFYNTAKLCFDKFQMFEHLKKSNIPTILTFGNINDFIKAYKNKEINFPVFVKPRTGSGSVGARKVSNLDELTVAVNKDDSLIIQEFMDGEDIDADVYVDIKSREVVSAFSKKKLSTTIGGANKTISFKDENLISLIKKIAESMELYGPNDMDFFFKDGEYFLSEINPRFGGAYLHAYGANVDFIKLICNNIKGETNEECFNNYEDNIVMMMYDSVVIKKID